MDLPRSVERPSELFGVREWTISASSTTIDHAHDPQLRLSRRPAAVVGDTLGIMTRELLSTADDGIARCGLVSDDPDYRRYHDDEWGRPLHGDSALFETIALEGFQAGLSWITILRRRPAFRSAFDGFSIERVSQFDDPKIDELAVDSSIIRNRQKIAATIMNARTIHQLVREKPGALDDLIWSHAPSSHRRPRTVDEVLTVTDASRALSKRLRSLGLTFVGPTTMHALMQAAGLINDHALGCTRGDQLENEAARLSN